MHFKLIFDINNYIKSLYKPSFNSHKGQNGKLLIIGGSHLFHAASLWSLNIASRIVDMVFYASVPENNEIVENAKKEFRDGIVVARENIDHYAMEADCILIGPGMVRREDLHGLGKNDSRGTDSTDQNKSFADQRNPFSENPSLKEINSLENEGQQTYELTKYMLTNYKDKKFVLDAGALQELDLHWLGDLKETPILTPHHQELEMLARNNNSSIDDLICRGAVSAPKGDETSPLQNKIILLKGQTDRIYSPNKDVIEIEGGVPGMTKGGTGDVLAGLIAALYCKNDAITSTVAASFFNKKAGEELASSVGNFFNSSDLVDQLPKTMHEYIS